MAYASPLLIQRGMNSHPATRAQYTHLLHGLDSLLFPTHDEPKAIPDPETDSIPMLCSLFGDPLDSSCPGEPKAKEGAHLDMRGTTRKGAGIMKLKVNGEAQELSDLDPATQRQLNRGARLVEVLKQGQYEPVPVAEQVAVIYVAGEGLIDAVPVEKVREWEGQYREALRLKHADLLASVATTGKLSDEAKAAFGQEATDLAASYSTSTAA